VSADCKELRWVGSSKKDLLDMPAKVIDTFGFALYLAQRGGKHVHSKPLQGFGGGGVLEVVEAHAGDTFRAVYSVNVGQFVYVLHCFQKKSKRGSQTPKQDMSLIRARLKIAQAHAAGVGDD